jgi:2-oxoglutarate ferredoxin oxidoreductase subunit gamma
MADKPTKKVSKKESEFKEKRYEVRLSGSGGQGLITAGVILGEAVAIGDGKNTAVTQSYGPEARGGRTRCDVIISDEEIFYPEGVRFDLLISLTQESADAYSPLLKENGIFVIDDDAVKLKPNRPFIGVSFSNSCKEKLGSFVSTNIVCLGFASEYAGIVTKKSIEEAVVGQFDEKYAAKNLDALKLGYELAKKAKSGVCTTLETECLDTEIDRT